MRTALLQTLIRSNSKVCDAASDLQMWPSLVTLARPPTSSSLRITDRSFRYASLCLWNQLPSTLRQPHPSPPVSDLPVPVPTTSSHSVNSPLSPSTTPSLFKVFFITTSLFELSRNTRSQRRTHKSHNSAGPGYSLFVGSVRQTKAVVPC